MKPTYFSKLPNINYPIRMNKAGVVEKVVIKDYFHLLRVRDDIFKSDTIYEPYYIQNGERPEQVSYDYYGDEQYYWIILQINEITDYYNEWPLSQNDLDKYILKKYGSIEASGEVHHYETIELKDKQGNIMLPGRGTPGVERGGRAQNGFQVPGDFTFSFPAFPESTTEVTFTGHTGNRRACAPISNRQYEYDLNEDKCQIFLLDAGYIGDYVREYDLYCSRIGNVLEGRLNVSDF